jgi:DNA-directed RNA polymerase subunit RPC12/RpoP
MSAVWTSHLRCFTCGKEFILNRVSLEEIHNAELFFPCPYCQATPSLQRPHHLNYLYLANVPYRKARDGDCWHFSEYCSGWPLENFLELDYPPEGEICNECKALVGNEPPG